jgi:hypothetical protein
MGLPRALPATKLPSSQSESCYFIGTNNQFNYIMIFRFSSLALGALLTASSLNLNAQGFGVALGSAEAAPDEIICVPVNAQGFTDILSFQYSLSWDPTVLQYDHIQNIQLPGFSEMDVKSNTPNILLVAWSEPTGFPHIIADGALVYEACFKTIGIVGNSTDITPGSEGFPPATGGAEAFNGTPANVWTPALNVPGFIQIVAQESTLGSSDAAALAQPSFQLSPNPTHASARVVLNAATTGKANLRVTDAAGKKVFEFNTSVQAGENTFEIPAKSLNIKGMYQVTLQTAQGISSQMLSVQ